MGYEMNIKTGELTKLIENYQYPEEAPRNYIGASIIGSPCLRQIWYEFKGIKTDNVPNKLKRTWNIGKYLERYVINLLEACGLTIISNQHILDYTDSELHYFKGHCDGLIVNKKSLLEIKTANDTNFRNFLNHGLKKWNPKYYAQIQAYMGMSGLFKAYLLVLNKDSSETWDEQIEFDAIFYGILREKAQSIYEAKTIPPRINNSPLWYQCKMCQFRTTCHN
jgi:hypothetical protein